MDQELIISIGKLLLGILVLVYSGNILVKGSVALANYFKISSLVIGLTVVAFGTSAPELIVSLDAAITNHSEIALGNVIGSNIANIALVLALTVMILPMPVAQQTIRRSWPFMFLSGIILCISMFTGGVIDRFEGLILVALLVFFIFNSIKSAKKFQQPIVNSRFQNKHSLWVYIIMVIIASAGLAFGSTFLVTGASVVAAEVGVSERVISITVVAFGTSVPELTASIIAAFKKETDISVGNIIGSNIFNVFAVIGITSGIHPIDLNFQEFRIDLIFMMLFFVLLFIFILPLKWLFGKNEAVSGSFFYRYKRMEGSMISRIEGIVLFSLYVIYLVLIF